MLKPSHKRLENAGIKKDGKIDAQEQLKWNQYHQYIFYTVFMSVGW